MTEQAQPAPFPRPVLPQAPQARLDYFKASTVAHPALKQADQAVWNARREPAGAGLIFIFGPSGVGKTTVLAQIEKRRIELSRVQGERQTGPTPVLRVDAVSPALNQFKWGDYSHRALLLLQEPFVEYPIDYRQPVAGVSRTSFEQPLFPRTGPTDTAALAFEQALKHRHPDAILIDEAEHIAKAARGAKLLDQLDHLKSLAIMTKTVHLLVGTYDLLVLRNLSAQLSRRSIDSHFSR
jgi:hypothetical protein